MKLELELELVLVMIEPGAPPPFRFRLALNVLYMGCIFTSSTFMTKNSSEARSWRGQEEEVTSPGFRPEEKREDVIVAGSNNLCVGDGDRLTQPEISRLDRIEAASWKDLEEARTFVRVGEESDSVCNNSVHKVLVDLGEINCLRSCTGVC